MPTKSRKRNNKNFVAIPFETVLTLGTLAENLVLSTDLLATSFDDDIYMISVDIAAQLIAQSAGEGPVHVGLAHSDYSDAEILEHLDVDPTERHDKIAQEQVRRGREIRKIGQFSIGTDGNAHLNLGGGTMIRKKLGFSINEGKSISVYAVNRGAGATTGRLVSVSGTLYCRWIS